MREIKFRAWIKDKKFGQEMFDVVMISWVKGGEIILSGRGGSVSKELCELMQSLGIKDKNDREIYEGDLLKWYHLNKEGEWIGDDGVFFEVFYHDDECRFKCCRCHYQGNRCGGYVPDLNSGKVFEIVGNIYQGTPQDRGKI